MEPERQNALNSILARHGWCPNTTRSMPSGKNVFPHDAASWEKLDKELRVFYSSFKIHMDKPEKPVMQAISTPPR
jgi:hypothetical protein